MHSSPSLRPCLRLAAVVMAAIALGSFGCSDSSAGEHDSPAEVKSDAATKSTATSPSTNPAQPSAAMTQVGTRKPTQRPSDSGMPKDMGMMNTDEDAAAPGNANEPKEADPGMPMNTLACSTDSDCKTFDSMCGSCRCLVLSKQTQPPGCGEPAIMCVVAPCLNKVAVCSSSMCTLKDVGPNSI